MKTVKTLTTLKTSERREGGHGAAAYPQPPLILATPHSGSTLIRMVIWMTMKTKKTSERREGGLGAAAYPQPPPGYSTFWN